MDVIVVLLFTHKIKINISYVVNYKIKIINRIHSKHENTMSRIVEEYHLFSFEGGLVELHDLKKTEL